MITFITVKGKSKRCPRKNFKLLPFVLEKVGSFLDIMVITDSEEIKEICEKYKVKYYIEDISKQNDEFTSIYHYLNDTKQLDKIHDFIILPVTQPLCNIETIMNVANCDLEDYDMITTYTMISDRKIFLLNDDNTFEYESYERKGALCPQKKMIDGCIYKMSTLFLKRMLSSSNVNHVFWNESKKKFILNSSDVFLDIDEKKDLEIFERYFFQKKN